MPLTVRSTATCYAKQVEEQQLGGGERDGGGKREDGNQGCDDQRQSRDLDTYSSRFCSKTQIHSFTTTEHNKANLFLAEVLVLSLANHHLLL